MAGDLAVPLLEGEFVWANNSHSIVSVAALVEIKPSGTKERRVVGSPHPHDIWRIAKDYADCYSSGCRADTFLQL